MKTTIPPEVTVVLTSCGRWDLLQPTLASFLDHHEPRRLIVMEDSADAGFARRITDAFPEIEVMLNDPRLGQHGSIDRGYAAVDTPFILHLEDDWHFSGPALAGPAMRLLGERADIAAVCFRHLAGLKLSHRLRAKRFRWEGGDYADMGSAHRDWYGYTFNPTLVRKALWEEHGPFALYPNERALSAAMKQRGYAVAFQLPGVAHHTGSGRSVFDPQRVGERRRLSRRSMLSRLLGK